MPLITVSMATLADAMRTHACNGDYFYDGRNPNTPYFQAARRIHIPTGTSLLFTRDIGHHASGWWKNPDYERCYHLSIAFFDLPRRIPRPYEPKLARAWCIAFYGDWTRYIWEESSKFQRSPDQPEVRHYRVFTDAAWQPIMPRGEVYSKELTESDWKSWSEQQGDKASEVEGTED